MMHRLVALAILAIFVLPSQARAAAAPKPGAVNLSLKDLGAGWTLTANTTKDNAEAARQDHKTVAQEAADGSLIENEATFARVLTANQAATVGLVGVDSQIIQYDTAAHAKAAYLHTVQIAAPAVQSQGYGALTLGAVGSLHRAWSATLPPQKGIKSYKDLVFFYRGDYLVALVGSAQGLNDTAQVLQFAHAIDGHIQGTALSR